MREAWAWACVAVVVVVVLTLPGSHTQQLGQACRNSEGRSGTCTQISQCSQLLSLLRQIQQNIATPGAVSRLTRSICQPLSRREPYVCCRSSTVSNPFPSLPSPPQPSPPQPSPSLLPSRCGISAHIDRIIDGENAPLLAWPWMAVLRGTANGIGQWFCGGSLISERYVLSAAHCFQPRQIDLEFVRIGEHNLIQNPDCEGGLCAPTPQDIPVEQIIIHPQYGQGCTYCNDIALLRLAVPATLNPQHVVPICLPVDPLRDLGFTEQEYQGRVAWAAGWGSIARGLQNRQPDVLQQVQLPIQNLQFCERLRSRYPDPTTVICAGGDGRDTCRGDSGGPLTLTNRVQTRHYVVGLTSLGPSSCGVTNTQAIYTNVAHYVPWILSSLRP